MTSDTATSHRAAGPRPRLGHRLAVRGAMLGVAAASLAGLAAATGPAQPAPAQAELTSSYAAVAAPRAITGSVTPRTEAVLLDRGLPVSRDTERQALGQASGEKVTTASSGVAKQENAALAGLANKAQEVANRTPQNTWKLPLQSYRLTATFGEGSNLWANRHTGLDFAAPTGTLLSSVTNGTVMSAAPAGAYGNRVVIRDDEGTEFYYCHMSAFAVQGGDKVTAGQTIGKVGATGNVTGPHLHLEVRPGGGDPVDPYRALTARGAKP